MQLDVIVISNQKDKQALEKKAINSNETKTTVLHTSAYDFISEMFDRRGLEQKRKNSEKEPKRIIDIYKSFKKRRKTIQLNELYNEVKTLKNTEHLNDGEMTVNESRFLENFRELPISIEEKRVLLRRVQNRKRRLSKYSNQKRLSSLVTGVYALQKVRPIRCHPYSYQCSMIFFLLFRFSKN
jgi:hypothetical protein